MGEVAPSSEPRVIGKYEVLLPIAKGGMGTVYLARMRGMGGFVREVAVKVVHEQEHDEEHALAQAELLEEAKIAARLRHPNVVPVIDVGEDNGRAFIVMEYVEGDSLAGLARKARPAISEPLPHAVGMRIMLDALAGLHAAHELTNEDDVPLGLVHRDFSPQNILIGSDGVARLTDFGVAKLVERTNATQSGIVKGKIRYLSPEQARGGKLDRRSDVWSAGVVLWELFARQKLWKADTDAAVLLSIVTEKAPKLSEIVPDVPGSISDIVAKALAPDREERHESALALRQALSRAVKEANLVVEHDEVATYVSRIAGPAIAERRSKILQRPPSNPQPMVPRPILATEETDTTSAAASLVAAGSQQAPATPTKTMPSTPIIIAACTLMALTGLGLLAFALTRHREKPPEPIVASTAPEPPPPPPPESAATIEVPPTTPGNKTRPVTFTANWNVKLVRFGDRSVKVVPPRQIVALTIPEEDYDVEVVSSDGRKASATLDKQTNALTIVFPPRAKPTEDLAPSPYKNNP